MLIVSLLAILVPVAGAGASVVERGYLSLSDATRLSYTLTLPRAEGRFPVVLQYDPYAAGVTSDPSWNDSGYAMLGVNFRGTGCSQGSFEAVRADVWGADGAEVVEWAARQPWSDGSVGMLGYSFTGTSQLATAAFAGPALKAIMPGNVFPDMYGDLVHPGGIYNGWIAAWVALGRQAVVGAPAIQQGATDPACVAAIAGQAAPNLVQTLDTAVHPFRDGYWARAPVALADRVRVPILGCVNWQDTTVYSRAFNSFRESYDPGSTWVVAGDGPHSACPISRARRVRFLDRYLKGKDNGWEREPHLLLIHELTETGTPERDEVPEGGGRWQSSYDTWRDLDRTLAPVTLRLRAGGRLALEAPSAPEAADSYAYGMPSANTPADWASVNRWNNPTVPGGALRYTTPKLARDAEFLGSGSADLWVSATSSDADLQVTISELRPDGREEFVQNGWLRLSHRRLDARRSTPLRPWQTHLESDAERLVPGTPVLARIEVQPFDHVFRAGSAIRLTIDTPGGWFATIPHAATITIHHGERMASGLVLAHVPGARARAPLPACGARLNHPCRAAAGAVPGGALTIPEAVPAARRAALELGRLRVLRGGGLRVTVRSHGATVHGVRLVLRDRAQRRVAVSRALTARARPRSVALRLLRPLRPGRYSLRATGRAGDRRIVATRACRLAGRSRRC